MQNAECRMQNAEPRSADRRRVGRRLARGVSVHLSGLDITVVGHQYGKGDPMPRPGPGVLGAKGDRSRRQATGRDCHGADSSLYVTTNSNEIPLSFLSHQFREWSVRRIDRIKPTD